MGTDYSREAAEAFIEEAVAREGPRRREGSNAALARAEAARKDGDLARRELLADGNAERLDALAAERSEARRARAEQARRRAIEASNSVARRLMELTPALPVDPESWNAIDRVTFIRTYPDAGVVATRISAPSTAGHGTGWAAHPAQAWAD